MQVFVSCRRGEQTWTDSDPKPARRLPLLLPVDSKHVGIRVGSDQLVHHLVEPLDEHRLRIGGSPLQLALDVIVLAHPDLVAQRTSDVGISGASRTTEKERATASELPGAMGALRLLLRPLDTDLYDNGRYGRTWWERCSSSKTSLG